MEMWIAVAGIQRAQEFWKTTPAMVIALYDMHVGRQAQAGEADTEAKLIAMFGR